MFEYFKNSFKRKIARRFHKKYPIEVHSFDLIYFGKIEFANWLNPLCSPKAMSQDKVNFFKKLVPEGSMCVDIGANVGEHTVLMALAVGKSGLVVSFDPNPIVFEVLETNAKLNPNLTNIKPFNCAISEEEDDFYYNSSEASFANGGISTEKISRHGKHQLSQKIKGVNLNTFLHAHFADNLPKLTLIKVDTEGYDKEILKSIQPLIRKYRPILIAECFPKLNKD